MRCPGRGQNQSFRVLDQGSRELPRGLPERDAEVSRGQIICLQQEGKGYLKGWKMWPWDAGPVTLRGSILFFLNLKGRDGRTHTFRL